MMRAGAPEDLRAERAKLQSSFAVQASLLQQVITPDSWVNHERYGQ